MCTPFQKNCSMKPIRSWPSSSTFGCLSQEKYVADWQKETSHFKWAMKKFKDDHPDYFASGAVHPRRYSPRRVLRGICEVPPQGMGQCDNVVVLKLYRSRLFLVLVIFTRAFTNFTSKHKK